MLSFGPSVGLSLSTLLLLFYDAAFQEAYTTILTLSTNIFSNDSDSVRFLCAWALLFFQYICYENHAKSHDILATDTPNGWWHHARLFVSWHFLCIADLKNTTQHEIDIAVQFNESKMIDSQTFNRF